MIKELKLKDFKIIKKEKKRSLFKEFVQSSLLMRYDVNVIRKNRVCNLVNGYINVIFLNNHSIKNC